MFFLEFIPYDYLPFGLNEKKQIFSTNFITDLDMLMVIFNNLEHPDLKDQMEKIKEFLGYEKKNFYAYILDQIDDEDVFEFEENDFLDNILREVYYSNPWDKNDI